MSFSVSTASKLDVTAQRASNFTINHTQLMTADRCYTNSERMSETPQGPAADKRPYM